MRAYGRSEFADRFAEKAADTDYSWRVELQDFSQYDIRAAAEALWLHLARHGIGPNATELNEQIIVTAMRARAKRYDDGGDLVAQEFENFWDACDEQPLSSATEDMIREDLVASFLSGQRKAGMIVVNNLHGIWLFNKNTIWKV